MTQSKRKNNETFAIQTHQLGKTFNGVMAVDGIDLDINKGELFALLGPNGAGKTTTINMLCCLLRPTGGTATIRGYDINKQPYNIKKIIGVSPQETSISEHLNVTENLSLIGRMHDIGAQALKRRSRELVETMGLAERAKDQVRKFSGGMKRRLSIMMALVHNPDILFLDEPTLGLDPQSRRALWSFIADLKGDKTVLLTTHYMDEADFLADRIAIMDEGKIVALGTSQALKARMPKKQTLVVSAHNITRKVIDKMQNTYSEVSTTDDQLQITDNQLNFKEIVDLLQSSGAIVRSASLKEPTLEDVFLHITGKELRE
jgi:ABC-2 type transport system ATP-binding protein